MIFAIEHPSGPALPATFAAIYQALDAHSTDLIGSSALQLLVIPIRDDQGDVTGGLWAATGFAWLHVEMLFVPEALRRQGVGSALLQMAEAEAVSRGCSNAHVDTFSFQALPFYECNGFSQFGVLDDFPPGHRRFYLRKRLADQPGMARSVNLRCSSIAKRSVMPAM